MLKHLEPVEGEPSEEVVRAKFVLGTDGGSSCFSFSQREVTLKIIRRALVGPEDIRHRHGGIADRLRLGSRFVICFTVPSYYER